MEGGSEKKFEDLMKKQGMEKIAKTPRQIFEDYMRGQNMEDVAEIMPEGWLIILTFNYNGTERKMVESFKTPEEREKWYNETGKHLESEFNVNIEYRNPDIEK